MAQGDLPLASAWGWRKPTPAASFSSKLTFGYPEKLQWTSAQPAKDRFGLS